MAFRAPAYLRYEGERARQPAWWAIWRVTFRRGWKSTWLLRFTVGSIGMAVAINQVMFFIQSVLPGWRTILEDLGRLTGQEGKLVGAFDNRFYLVILQWFIYPFLLPLGAILGYELIAGDLKSNALEAYFSRPITPWSYLLGRTGAFTAYLLLVTLAPLLWIWTFDVMTAPDGHFDKVSMVPLGMATAMTILALTVALFIQALATFTRSGTATAISLVALVVLSGTLGPILFEITGKDSFLAIAFYQDIYTLASGFLGWPFEQDNNPPFALALGVISGILLGSLAILTLRIRRKGNVG